LEKEEKCIDITEKNWNPKNKKSHFMQKKKKTIGELNPSGGVIDGIFLGSSEMK
jgi:hypothetical protein